MPIASRPWASSPPRLLMKSSNATARNNARAALNFLGTHPPDLSEVKEALDCIVADADRAGDIIDRIASCIKKEPPRKEVVWPLPEG
jgi:hypothetical protein